MTTFQDELSRLNKDVTDINTLIKEMPLRSYFKRRFHILGGSNSMPQLSNLALIVDPLIDSAGSVATTGQAFTKTGCTNLADGSGWSLAFDKLSGIAVAGAYALISQPSGYTFFSVQRPGARNTGTETNVFGLDDRASESSGLWVQPGSQTKLDMLYYQFLVRDPGFPGAITAMREDFFSQYSTGVFPSPDSTLFDYTIPHVFAWRYDRTKTGNDRCSVFIDGVRQPIYPPDSSTNTNVDTDDGSAPAVYQPLSSDNMKFGPHSGTNVSIGGAEFSPERQGAVFGYNTPLIDAQIIAATTFIQAHYPLLNT